jgi:hypothetical protein
VKHKQLYPVALVLFFATNVAAQDITIGVTLGTIGPSKPGTPEFRQALRDALENVHNLVATHGVYNVSASDHSGLDRPRVLVRVENGDWQLLK